MRGYSWTTQRTVKPDWPLEIRGVPCEYYDDRFTDEWLAGKGHTAVLAGEPQPNGHWEGRGYSIPKYFFMCFTRMSLISVCLGTGCFMPVRGFR